MTGRTLITIYGLFAGAECLYVGATINPRNRERQWRNGTSTLKGLKGVSWILKPLFKCAAKNANQREVETIKAYKASGQAGLNKTLRGRPERMGTKLGVKVICRSLGKVFDSYSDAGRYFGCSPVTIRNAIKHYSGALVANRLGGWLRVESISDKQL